jgi:uncharacterized protein (DUF488 family)
VKQIWTIGHSTRSADEFIEVLQAHAIRLVADVRLLPGSKRYPHFNSDELAALLRRSGIGYEHFRELGGRRRPKPESVNTAWKNESFRGYADHMETEQFRSGIDRLRTAADAAGPTALMCAEAVWWRCHRGLIADYLKARDVEVLHITGPGAAQLHPWTSAARVVEGVLSYSAAEEPRLL